MMACVFAACATVRPEGPEGTVQSCFPGLVGEPELDEWVATLRRHEARGWSEAACAEATSGLGRLEAEFGPRARSRAAVGLVAERCGRPDEAEGAYREALLWDPDACFPRVALALASMREGGEGPSGEGRDRAMAALAEAVRRDPTCTLALSHLAALQSQDPALHDEAIANLRRTLAFDADSAQARDQLAVIYLRQSAEAPERLQMAEVVCRQAYRVDPRHAPLFNTWALVAVARGDLSEAVAKLERAVELDPALYEAHMNLGQLTLSQRAYADAERAFTTARRLRPGSYDAAVGLGVALRALGRPAEAERVYREAIARSPERPEAYFDSAVLHHEHLEGTVAQLERAEALLGEFVARATESHRAAREATLRWCAPGARRCRPGRAQNIHDSLVALGERSEEERPPWTR
tara:strand:- start:101 stop:1327 length:1227 start_codon:yes stop_codon:yes gene_type:complete